MAGRAAQANVGRVLRQLTEMLSSSDLPAIQTLLEQTRSMAEDTKVYEAWQVLDSHKDLMKQGMGTNAATHAVGPQALGGAASAAATAAPVTVPKPQPQPKPQPTPEPEPALFTADTPVAPGLSVATGATLPLPERSLPGYAQPTAAAASRTLSYAGESRGSTAARDGRDASIGRSSGRPSRWSTGGSSAGSSHPSSRRERSGRSAKRPEQQRSEDERRHRGERTHRRNGESRSHRSSRRSSSQSSAGSEHRRRESRGRHRAGSHSSRDHEDARSVSSSRTVREGREQLRQIAKDPKLWSLASVERALAETERMEPELEEERDVLKAMQVRLVLEDTARLTARHKHVTTPYHIGVNRNRDDSEVSGSV